MILEIKGAIVRTFKDPPGTRKSQEMERTTTSGPFNFQEPLPTGHLTVTGEGQLPPRFLAGMN